MPASHNRRKLSTTVARETHNYLQSLVARGKATSIAEAVDLAVARAKRDENRLRLEAETAAYFAKLNGKDLDEDRALASAVASLTDEVDFDR